MATNRTFPNMLNERSVTNVPFKSKSQQRYMFANKPELAKKFAKETKNFKSLPEKAGKKESPWMKMKG